MNKKRIDYYKPTQQYRVRLYHDGTETHHGYYDTLREARVCSAGHHWIDGQTPYPTEFFGFIYLVEDELTGMKYIGSKQYVFYNGVCKGTPNDMDADGWSGECWKESDWRSYKTSSKLLRPIIAERPSDFTMTILSQHRSKLALFKEEVRVQEEHKVLTATTIGGQRAYWNQHIARCEFNVFSGGEKVSYGLSYNPWYKTWRENKDSMYKPWEEDPSEFIKFCEINCGEATTVVLGDPKQLWSPWNCEFKERVND